MNVSFRQLVLKAMKDVGWANEEQLFLAGAAVALEQASIIVAEEGWLRSDPGEAVDPRVDISELLLRLAKELR